MQKHDSKTLCKNDQKWCPNEVKIDQKTIKMVVKSRCENRCENRCKTAPSKGGSAEASSPPLVVLSRYTLLLVSQTHISTTNQTLNTALRHRYADARPDLSAPCGASTAAPSLCRSALWCVRLLQLLAFCKRQIVVLQFRCRDFWRFLAVLDCSLRLLAVQRSEQNDVPKQHQN